MPTPDEEYASLTGDQLSEGYKEPSYGSSLGSALGAIAGIPAAVVHAGQNVGIFPGGPDSPPAAERPPTYKTIQEAEKATGGKGVGVPGTPGNPIDVGEVTPVVAGATPVPARRGTGGSGPAPSAAATGGDFNTAPAKIEDSGVATALAASGVDPTVARYLAAQQAQADRLKGAQRESNMRQDMALGLEAMDSGFGIGSAAESAARAKWAGQPVADVQAQQESADKGLEHAAKEQSFFSEADKANPQSAANVAFRNFYAQRGLKLPPNLTMAQSGPLADHFEKANLEAAKDKRMLTIEREKTASTESEGEKDRKNRILLEQMKLNAEKAKAGKEKDIPARSVVQLQGADEEDEAARKLEELAPKVGFLAAITPGNHANRDYEAAKTEYGQARGKAIHGGPSGEAAKGFEATIPSPYFSTEAGIKGVAQRIHGEATEDRERQNRLLQSQGISNPLPPIPQRAQRRPGPDGRMREKGPDGLWHLVK